MFAIQHCAPNTTGNGFQCSYNFLKGHAKQVPNGGMTSLVFSRLFQTGVPASSETAPALPLASEPHPFDEVSEKPYVEVYTCRSPPWHVYTPDSVPTSLQEDDLDTDLTPKQVVDRLDRYIVGQVMQSSSA